MGRYEEPNRNPEIHADATEREIAKLEKKILSRRAERRDEKPENSGRQWKRWKVFPERRNSA